MDHTAEMIFTGDELLRGETINTNQAFLGEGLLDLGVFPDRSLCVRDDLAEIVAAIRDSLTRRPVVLILSGGLGPTEDDLTREAVAEALGRPLEHHEPLLEEIRRRFESRGYTMTDSNRKQALLPRGASAIPISGTAPGFTLDEGGTLVVALPGVPWELKEMWTGTVEPLLRNRLLADGAAAHVVRRVRTFGIGESLVADLLAGLDWRGGLVEIGTRAHPESLSIILRAVDSTEGMLELEAVQSQVCALLGERVFGIDSPGLPEIVSGLLTRAGLTVAVAESCTGGLVAKYLTDIPGSSEYMLGGVVAYSNDVKTKLLGVEEHVLATHGAGSREAAEQMVVGVSRALGAGCALSTTGIAGPGGGTAAKPVGLVYIGSALEGTVQVEELRLFGRREHVRERAALSALDQLRRRLLQRVPSP
jgi:nicotinamide-nucleotide amidase